MVTSTMILSVEDRTIALSTFFRTNDIITDIKDIAMSSKSTKKSTAKPTNLYAKPIVTKKDTPKKSAMKKKVVTSSSEEDSSSDDSSSSEDEPPKKSKKKVAKNKKKVVTSSEESSSEDEEIIVEKISEHVAVPDGLAKLGEGLVAIAEQIAVSNAANTKILDVLLEVLKKMEVREQKVGVDDDLLEVIDDVVARGEAITIGNEDSVIHRFESVGHLRADSGKLAVQSNFTKVINVLSDEVIDVTA